MVLLEKLWDDVVAGPQPDSGLGMLRKPSAYRPPLTIATADLEGESSTAKSKKSPSVAETPPTPATPVTPTTPQKKPNVWRSVFHPGSNLATKGLGTNLFDRPQPNSPTVYDWLYSGETKSSHR